MRKLSKSDNGTLASLQRFITAQERDYKDALSELRNGQKRTCWMWYIFPQVDGLGISSTSQYYAIKSLEEAHAYLTHPVLGTRLMECVKAVLAIRGRTVSDIFGSPDDLKLRSSMTLFSFVIGSGQSPFDDVITKFFQGRQDEKTVQLITKLLKGQPRMASNADFF